MTDPDPFLQVVEYVRNQHREIEDAAILPRPGMSDPDTIPTTRTPNDE